MPDPHSFDELFTIQPYSFQYVDQQTSRNNQEKLFQQWQKDSPVPLDRLRLVNFPHYTFDGTIQKDGCFVVLDAVAEHVKKIVQTLFEMKFPLESAIPIEQFHGNDAASMEANNSSAYNCRKIAGENGRISIHSYGLAIDINPIQNPYIYFSSQDNQTEGRLNIAPLSGIPYMNRHKLLNENQNGLCENIVDVFFQNGFTEWGGFWTTPLDWHHFQTPRTIAELLGVMDPEHATLFFESYVHAILHLHADPRKNIAPNTQDFAQQYTKNPRAFMNNYAKGSAVWSEF